MGSSDIWSDNQLVYEGILKGHAMLFKTFDGQWLMSVHSHYVDKQGRYIRKPHFFLTSPLFC